jgi:hypothetical protein
LPEVIDQAFEMTADFVSAVFRVMPHANEPERMNKIIAAMKSLELVSLSEFPGGKVKVSPLDQPAFGQTDIEIYAMTKLLIQRRL